MPTNKRFVITIVPITITSKHLAIVENVTIIVSARRRAINRRGSAITTAPIDFYNTLPNADRFKAEIKRANIICSLKLIASQRITITTRVFE